MKEIFIFELKRILTKSWFWILTFSFPVFVLSFGTITSLLETSIFKNIIILVSGEECIVEQTRLILSQDPLLSKNSCQIKEITSMTHGIDLIKKKKADIFIEFKDKKCFIYSIKSNKQLEGIVVKYLQYAHMTCLLLKSGLSRAEINNVQRGLPVVFKHLQNEVKSGSEFIVLLFIIIFYSSVVLFGEMLAHRVMEDKESNFIDILLLYRRPSTIFRSKLLVALASYSLYIFITLLSIYAIVNLWPNPHIETFFAILKINEIVILILLIFLFAFLMYSSFFLFAGSISNITDDLKRYSSIINFVLIGTLVITSIFNQLPDMAIKKILFYFFPITPFFMLSDVIQGKIDFFKIIIGLIIIVVVSLFMLYFAAKQYEVSAVFRKRIKKK